MRSLIRRPSQRPRRRPEKACAIIVEGSGTQFDPAIVDVFIKCEKDFAKLAETMVDEPPSHEDAVLELSGYSGFRPQ